MRETKIEAIVIGGSAGALDVLTQILPALPRDYSLPIALVLHLPANNSTSLAQVLAPNSVLTVKEAEDKEPLEPATIYVAPSNYHLLLERGGRCSLSIDPPVHFSRPAIDVLFESAADAYGAALAGVLLTGASEDGARGLRSIGVAGGRTIVQAPETAWARTMPMAGLRLARVDEQLTPGEIGPFLANLDTTRKRKAE